MDNFRNTELGTRRNHRTLPAMDPSYVRLDDSSPMDLLREAIALARQLRFVATDTQGASWDEVLQVSQADWSKFLGTIDGPVYAEFQRFFADPDGYVAQPQSPISQPHVALFAAFIRILRHASSEINGFAERHLDHYFYEELKLKPQPAQPAEVYVVAELKEGANATIIPEGSRLLAPDLDSTVVFASNHPLELHAGKLARIASMRAAFETTGLRKLLDPKLPEGGMAAIKAKVWQRGYQTRLAAGPWTSFQQIVDTMEDRQQIQRFPAAILQVTLDEFRRMMALAPKAWPLSEEEELLFGKWEAMYARMILCEAYPQPEDAVPDAKEKLPKKLSGMLFNGTVLPKYKNAPLDLLELLTDLTQHQSASDVEAALAYVNEVLFLDEEEFKLLCELDNSQQGLPKSPQILTKAMIAKAASLAPELLPKRLTKVTSTLDATQARHKTGGWFPYGQSEGADVKDSLGFMIESPLLDMAEGDRKITLTLEFAPTDFAMLRSLFGLSTVNAVDWYAPFTFRITTEKAWLDLDWRKTAPRFTNATRQVEFTLEIPATLPSITGPGEKFEDARLIGKGPMLHIRLAPPIGLPHAPAPMAHDLFCQSLRLNRVKLAVSVTGLREFVAENHQGAIKVTAPFEPFGSNPGPGAAFMIAHPEVCFKKIDSLDLQFDWMNLPSNVGQHYDPYFVAMGSSPAITDRPHQKADFLGALELVRGRWTNRLGAGDLAFLEPNLHVTTTALEPIQEEKPKGEANTWGKPSDWPRYIRLAYRANWDPQLEYERASRRLNAAINAASNAFSMASLAYATAPNAVVDGQTNTARYNAASALLTSLSSIVLQPPYVPKLKGLTLGYTASVDIPMQAWSPNLARQEQLYHSLPFGHRALPVGNGAPVPLLPRFASEGAVMLGFDGLVGSEALSLLVKVQVGSGNPDALPPAVQWRYYGFGGWRGLGTKYIHENETHGLTQTGLLKLHLPADAQRSVADLPQQLHWIMASVDAHSDDLPDWVGVHLHALSARQVPGSATTPGLWQAPSGSVTVTEQAFPGISQISQPYPSHGGRPDEPREEFFRRVSERLRHKNRAVNAWDYEHLCLEHFPELFAAKTVPAEARPDRQVGEFTVVVIPDLRKIQFSDVFQPRLGFGDLNKISDFLASRSPSFAKAVVRNPTYRRVAISTTINFKPGYSEAASKQRIQQRLQEYLAPWAFDHATEMAFGGRLYVSEIIDFLQSEPYVGFVGKTRMFVDNDKGEYTEQLPTNGDSSIFIEAGSTEVITTAPGHVVNTIAEDNAQNEIWSGISWMVIAPNNGSFIVSDSPNPTHETYEYWNGISWEVVGRDFNVNP